MITEIHKEMFFLINFCKILNAIKVQTFQRFKYLYFFGLIETKSTTCADLNFFISKTQWKFKLILAKIYDVFTGTEIANKWARTLPVLYFYKYKK